MAFFEAGQDANVPEDDPAADFLAREQTELAGLEDDNLEFTQSSEPQQDGFDGFENQPDAQGDYNAEQDFFGVGNSETNAGGPDFGTESSNNDIFGDEKISNGPSDAYAAVATMDEKRAEPEKIKIWREEQSERLEEKDASEETRKDEWRDSAKKELEDWYKHHAEQLEKTKSNNRAAEDAFVKERDESIPGQQWEKICRLCEFNPKNIKTTKDVSRMRSLLLQLKQTPLVR